MRSLNWRIRGAAKSVCTCLEKQIGILPGSFRWRYLTMRHTLNGYIFITMLGLYKKAFTTMPSALRSRCATVALVKPFWRSISCTREFSQEGSTDRERPISHRHCIRWSVSHVGVFSQVTDATPGSLPRMRANGSRDQPRLLRSLRMYAGVKSTQLFKQQNVYIPLIYSMHVGAARRWGGSTQHLYVRR